MTNQTTIPITFAKSHLTTIGERLYTQSLDLVRELVANAFDADATWVKILVEEETLAVEDNGSGMDRKGLQQYFTIGSEYKRLNPVSERFKRQRIGEFGIGKFAVLAVCERFELFTRCDGYAATVIFDKGDFEKKESWEVPVIEHSETYATSGTRVTLHQLRRPVVTWELERKLRQQLPLSDKNFTVALNGVNLTPTYIPGRRFLIRGQTRFGPVRSEVIIASLNTVPKEEVGIGVKVKGVTIKRMFFGLNETKIVSPGRITGQLTADFLPLTASRDNFLLDSNQWREFNKVIKSQIKRITRELRKAREAKEVQAADRTLSEALIRVRNALKKNRDIFLFHDLPLFQTESDKREATIRQAVGEGVFTQRLAKKAGALAKVAKLPGEVSRQLPKITRHRVKTVLKDQKRLVKRLKIGGVNIVCSLSSLGSDEVESFTEGGIIFINRDHPLFMEAAKDEEVASFNLARLITKEITLLARAPSPDQAFDWQARLLTDALVEKRKPVISS